VAVPESVSCATVTFEALNWSTTGGCIPGGMMRAADSDADVIWAIAPPMSDPCSK
jgi:hypothetical protein